MRKNIDKRITPLLSVLLIPFLLAACIAQQTPAPTQISQSTSPTPTVVAPTVTSVSTRAPSPTPQPQTPTSTPTTSPTLQLQTPASSPMPSPTSQSSISTPDLKPRRIRFVTGAASATVTGILQPGGVNRYVLRALAGQTLIVDITAPHPVLLSIWGIDGTVLKRAMDGTAHWEGELPSTQDYVLELASTGPAIDYNLTVTIPRLLESTATPALGLYRSAEHGFEIRYPADFVTGVTCPTEAVVNDPVVSFRLVGDRYYASTNLLDACVTVGVDRSEIARSTCTGLRDQHEDYWGQEEIGGVLFSIVSRGGVATGHIYDVTSYRALHAGACYEITLFLHYSEIGVYSPGTVSEFDREIVMSRLRHVLYSFRFIH